MNLFKKIKNNKGSAESAMFVLGIAIFALVVVFAMDLFGLTWQRYLSTRELSNMSRLYAIRATDLYIKDNTSGTVGNMMITNMEDSSLAKEMTSIMKMIVKHGKMEKATLIIKDDGNSQIFKIVATKDNAKIDTNGTAGYDTFKQINYGDVLFAELKIEYKNHGFIVGRKNNGLARVTEDTSEYTIKNKFAFEQFSQNSQGVA